jgi:hypothetical protein
MLKNVKKCKDVKSETSKMPETSAVVISPVCVCCRSHAVNYEFDQ